MPNASELLEAAQTARVAAYAPYSTFTVGAAILCDDGTVVTGCNVENASYGLSMCAERTAIFAAVAAGHRSFRAIAVAGPDHARTSPCGACRQVLVEFGPEMPVTYTIPGGMETTTAAALLPDGFIL